MRSERFFSNRRIAISHTNVVANNLPINYISQFKIVCTFQVRILRYVYQIILLKSSHLTHMRIVRIVFNEVNHMTIILCIHFHWDIYVFGNILRTNTLPRMNKWITGANCSRRFIHTTRIYCLTEISFFINTCCKYTERILCVLLAFQKFKHFVFVFNDRIFGGIFRHTYIASSYELKILIYFWI